MQVGTRTIVDVLTARQNLLTAQTSFSNARYTYLESVMQLKQAAGILNETDIKQINGLMQVKVPGADMSIPETGETGAPAAGTSAVPAVAAPAAGSVAPAASTPPKS
jgi:hypothetical protein